MIVFSHKFLGNGNWTRTKSVVILIPVNTLVVFIWAIIISSSRRSYVSRVSGCVVTNSFDSQMISCNFFVLSWLNLCSWGCICCFLKYLGVDSNKVRICQKKSFPGSCFKFENCEFCRVKVEYHGEIEEFLGWHLISSPILWQTCLTFKRAIRQIWFVAVVQDALYCCMDF